MSTAEHILANSQGNIPRRGSNTSDGFIEIPSCTIEDIDRAIFNLFNEDLPLFYELKKQTKRVPIVFASGERFALISRKKPLRDNSNALILPIISILRSSISAENEMGLPSNQVVPHIIKKKISRKDVQYQRLQNKLNLTNSDDLPTSNSFLNSDSGSTQQNAQAGRIATRRSTKNSVVSRSDSMLEQSIDDNIIEVIEMPPPKFLTVTYDIMIWAQYVQQMNEILMSIISNSQNFSQRTFRIETTKGYNFVAYMDAALSSNNNFDEFTSDERLIRESFSMKVPGYILGETYKGAPNKLRSVQSSPVISFEMNFVNGKVEDSENFDSSDPKNYVLDDRTVQSSLPGQTISTNLNRVSLSQRNIEPGQETALVGGTSNDVLTGDKLVSENPGGSGTPNRTEIVTEDVNPFTGLPEDKRSYLKTRTSRNGETVYREIF